VGAPAEATDDVAGVELDGFEGSVEDGAAEGIVDDVKAEAHCVFGDVGVDGRVAIDGRGPKCFDEGALVSGDGGENFCAVGESDLYGSVADTTGSGVDEDGLCGVSFYPSFDLSAVDEAFPCGDGDEW
jgi:hypothetical protein